MQPKSGKPPRSARLATTGVELSRAAQVRLAWMDFQRRTQNVALTCRHFGISRQTFYRWLKRYEPLDLTTLEERSHCPHHRRRPTWSLPLESRVLTLRLQFPRWGKDKLAVLLRRGGVQISTSLVGRILSRLRDSGQLREPLRLTVPGSRRRLRPRPYAVRKPKQYAVSRPGDLVEVDTLELRPLPGVVFKQFTARDVVSRWDVIQAHGRATAFVAASSWKLCCTACPFPSAPCKLTADRSSPPSSSTPAKSAACICLSCPRALPSSTVPSSAPTVLIARSSISSTPVPWR